MFIEERHQAILNLIAQNGKITTSEIQEQFGVSYDSAKRDLRILEEKGLLKRTHGGAIPARQIASGKPPMVTCKDIGEVKDNYMAIAQKAVSMIQNHDVIFITSSSSTKELNMNFTIPSLTEMLSSIIYSLSKNETDSSF